MYKISGNDGRPKASFQQCRGGGTASTGWQGAHIYLAGSCARKTRSPRDLLLQKQAKPCAYRGKRVGFGPCRFKNRACKGKEDLLVFKHSCAPCSRPVLIRKPAAQLTVQAVSNELRFRILSPALFSIRLLFRDISPLREDPVPGAFFHPAIVQGHLSASMCKGRSQINKSKNLTYSQILYYA